MFPRNQVLCQGSPSLNLFKLLNPRLLFVKNRRFKVAKLLRFTDLVSSKGLFVEFTLEKSRGSRETKHLTGTHPCGDHARLCLTFGFYYRLSEWPYSNHNLKEVLVLECWASFLKSSLILAIIL